MSTYASQTKAQYVLRTKALLDLTEMNSQTARDVSAGMASGSVFRGVKDLRAQKALALQTTIDDCDTAIAAILAAEAGA